MARYAEHASAKAKCVDDIGGAAKDERVKPPSAVEDDANAEALLWQAHAHSSNAALRERLILSYLPYARTVAAMLYRRHAQSEIAFDDYLQWASLGMIEALDRYDPRSAASFRTYALPRMRGAICDGLAQCSERQQQAGLQRNLVAEREGMASPRNGLRQEAGLLRRLSGLGIGLALEAAFADTGMLQGADRTVADPCYAAAEARQSSARLRRLLECLTPRERSVIRLHYLQEFSFDEVCKALGISKGRVSQLHERALARLARHIGDTEPG